MIFGEALAFYELLKKDNKLLVVYHNLTNQENILGKIRGTWSPDISVLSVESITDKIGIWKVNGTPAQPQANIWILRKHPGLAMLNAAETGENDDIEGSIGMDEYKDD